MAQYEHLPIYKASFDLLLHIEKVVAGFSRANKFSIGADLRALARRCLRLIVRANNVRDRLPVLEELRVSLEELKILIRVCKETRAFANFKSFESCVNQVVTILRQNEGWLKSLSGNKTTGRRPESPTEPRTGVRT